MTYRATADHAGLGVRKGESRKDLDPDAVEVRSGLFAAVTEHEPPDYADRIVSKGGGWYEVDGVKVQGYDMAVNLAAS